MTKTSEPELTGKQIIERAKAKAKQQKKEKNNEMKTPTKTTLVAVASVVLTLAVVAGVVAVFFAGTQYQQGVHESIAEAKADAVQTALKTDEQK